MKSILADTGPLVALLLKKDPHHRSTARWVASNAHRLLSTWPVVTETCHFLGLEGKLALFQFIERGALVVADMAAGDVKLMGMAGIFLGAEGAVRASLYAFVAGGVLALAWLIVLKFKGSGVSATAVLKDVAVDNGIATAFRQRENFCQTDSQASKRLPYAIAITTGIGAHFVFLASIPRLAA